jgi:hypothetical protein
MGRAGAFGEGATHPPNTTPAKAGAQLGNDGNGGQSSVIKAFPIGPRPPPGG